MRQRVTAFTNSSVISQLRHTVFSKLAKRSEEQLPSKQAVAGSSPVSRSNVYAVLTKDVHP